MISKHFTSEEFVCSCCGELKVDKQLLNTLEIIRNHFDTPMVVTCGYRCKLHNKEVGGVKNSLHLIGFASDFYFKGLSINDTIGEMQELHSKIKWGGLGIYKNKHFYHVDIGKYRAWEG